MAEVKAMCPLHERKKYSYSVMEKGRGIEGLKEKDHTARMVKPKATRNAILSSLL